MGNFSSKEHPAASGHPDVFHTPPTSPTGDGPPSLQRRRASLPPSPLAAPLSPPPPDPAQTPAHPRQSGPAPSAPSLPPDWKPPSPPSGPTRLVIGGSGDGLQTSPPQVRSAPPGGPGVRSAPSLGRTPAAPDPPTPPPADGRPPPGLREGGGPSAEGLGAAMETLVGQCVSTLGLAQDAAPGTAELLQSLLAEIHRLRTSLQAERGEWLQFQADLQVAVTVADRLRAEAEAELLALRGARRGAEEEQAAAPREAEEELDAAPRGRREADAQRETLRGAAPRGGEEVRPGGAGGGGATPPQGARRESAANGSARGTPTVARKGEEPEADAGGVVRKGEEPDADAGGVVRKGEEPKADTGGVVRKGEEPKVAAGGVARRYMKNVTVEGGTSRTDETRTPGATQRWRSLSRVALSLDSHAGQNGTPESSPVQASSWSRKNSAQPKGHRSVDWPESPANHAGKREELLNKYNTALSELLPTKSQDGFNMLLRRHGGSKRNSLLRWCQNRTLGYKNMDLTNFSSSWADGLAFCAVYHSYLPSLVPFSSLRPEDKRENLNLAFKTGENLGIACSLTVEEMLRPRGPDWQCVLGYVESMYRHFEM